jgi:hypothetical protein
LFFCFFCFIVIVTVASMLLVFLFVDRGIFLERIVLGPLSQEGDRLADLSQGSWFLGHGTSRLPAKMRRGSVVDIFSGRLEGSLSLVALILRVV